MGKPFGKSAVQATDNKFTRGGSGNSWRLTKGLKGLGIKRLRDKITLGDLHKRSAGVHALKGAEALDTGWQKGEYEREVGRQQKIIDDKTATEKPAAVSRALAQARQRLAALRERAFRGRINDDTTSILHSSQHRLSEKSMAAANHGSGPAVKKSSAAPTLHAVPTGGNVALKSAATLEGPRPNMADPAEPKQNQLNELSDSGAMPVAGDQPISDEEFKKIKDKAEEVSGTQMLS